MAVSDYNTDPNLNLDISGNNIAEGCPPSGINNAIRQMMADVKAADDANVKLTGTQAISGTKTFSGGVTFSGGTVFSGTMWVRNTATFSSGVTVSSGGLTAKAGAAVSGGLAVSGGATVNGGMTVLGLVSGECTSATTAKNATSLGGSAAAAYFKSAGGSITGTLTIASGGMIKLAGPNTNIPATSSASMSKYLRGDGNWADVTSAASAGNASSLGGIAASGYVKTTDNQTISGTKTFRGTTRVDSLTVSNGMTVTGLIDGTAVLANSAAVAEKIGTATVGGAAKPVYISAGTPKAMTGALPASLGGTGATTLASAGIVTKVAASNVTFASATARNGYAEMNNGGTKMQVAWGRTSATADGNATITFARAFGAAPFVVAAAVPASDPSISGNVLNAITGPATTSGAKVLIRTQNGTPQAGWVNYIAIGTGA